MASPPTLSARAAALPGPSRGAPHSARRRAGAATPRAAASPIAQRRGLSRPSLAPALACPALTILPSQSPIPSPFPPAGALQLRLPTSPQSKQ